MFSGAILLWECRKMNTSTMPNINTSSEDEASKKIHIFMRFSKLAFTRFIVLLWCLYIYESASDVLFMRLISNLGPLKPMSWRHANDLSSCYIHEIKMLLDAATHETGRSDTLPQRLYRFSESSLRFVWRRSSVTFLNIIPSLLFYSSISLHNLLIIVSCQ